jgi:hypothetical protein
MPTSKQTALARKSTALTPKSKKQAPPPPPPYDEDPPAKPGKKHAKKHPKKHADKPSGKHLRRAFEHLGRVEALQALTEIEAVATLVRLAQTSITRDDARPAADLLRAAEHLSFASAANTSASAAPVSPDLEQAIRREFRKLLEHAEEHDLAKDTSLSDLLRQTLDDARTAFDKGNFRGALELARAAEALASIKHHDADKLEDTRGKRAPKE